MEVIRSSGIYDLLPKELWLQIADKMSADSQINLYRCCREFYCLLHSKKTTMLFSKVIPIIDGQDLLISRIVCKAWNQSILNFMKYHASHRSIDKVHQARVNTILATKEIGITPVRFKTSKDFKKHLNNMKTSHTPLPGNSIEVHLGEDDDLFELIYRGNQWFEIFGVHVLYMKFLLQVSTSNILIVYATMRDWIKKCPDLTLLALRGTFDPTGQEADTIMQTLQVQIRIFGLEFGPFIETLQYDFQNFSNEICCEVFRALEGSIKKLCFQLEQWTKKTDIMFMQVTDLTIENVFSIVVLNDFLKSCFPPNACFNRLKLKLKVTIDWTDILIILRPLKVNSLEIQDSSEKTQFLPLLTNICKARLKIYSLTQLSVFDDIGLTFDFLVNFPCLKYLQVAVFSLEGRDKKIFQKFVKAPGKRQLDITIRDTMYKNLKPNYHLWLTLPSLKRFLVQKFVDNKEKIETYYRDISIKRRSRILVLLN